MVYLFLIIAGLALLVFVVWRAVSQRHALPCPVWLRWMVEMDNPFTKTNRATVIIEHLRLERGMRVIDIGCGPGRLTIPLARAVGGQGSVIALDMQTGMLDRVRKKAGQANLHNIEFIHTPVSDASLPNKHFDRALLVTVLGEIPDKLEALRRIHALLKADGILSITEVIFDPHFIRRSTLIKLAGQTNFEVRAMFGNAIAYTMHLGIAAGE